jgi:hypothetical protein
MIDLEERENSRLATVSTFRHLDPLLPLRSAVIIG